MVVACLALAVSLSGVGYAAVSLPKSSVGTAQLRDGAVTSQKIRNRSLLALDFRLGELPTGTAGPAGPVGPKGADGTRGEQGPKGNPGTPGTTAYEIVNVPSVFDATDVKSADAFCPAGKKLIGGGAYVNSNNLPVVLVTSLPRADGTGWIAAAKEYAATTSDWNVHARAICAVVAP